MSILPAMCNSIHNVADYIIDRLTSDEEMSLIHLKLQKLLYYVQAWSLGINGHTMFEGKFQAWVHGPVNRDIYERFADKSLYGFITRNDIRNNEVVLSNEDKDFINYILENYAGFSGTQLEHMTHEEFPWQEARRGFSPEARCTREISEHTMLVFYAQRWKELNQ